MGRLIYKELSVPELVTIIKENGEHAAFGELYDRYVKTVLNKCQSFVRDKPEAEDLTQEIFVKVYEKLGTFDNKNFGGWLMRLTYNACVDHSRKKSIKYKREEVIENYHIDEDIEETDKLIMGVKLDALESILTDMDPTERTLLVLKYQEERKVKDLATLFDLSESAVKMRLSRARFHILDKYEKEYATPG